MPLDGHCSWQGCSLEQTGFRVLALPSQCGPLRETGLLGPAAMPTWLAPYLRWSVSSYVANSSVQSSPVS